jgi:hypothetical protein
MSEGPTEVESVFDYLRRVTAERDEALSRLGEIQKLLDEPRDEMIDCMNLLERMDRLFVVERQIPNTQFARCQSSVNHDQCELPAEHEGKHSTHLYGSLFEWV